MCGRLQLQNSSTSTQVHTRHEYARHLIGNSRKSLTQFDSPTHSLLAKDLRKGRSFVSDISPPRIVEEYVAPIPRNSKRIFQEREKGVAVCFGTLRRDIVQAYHCELERGIKGPAEREKLIVPVGNRDVFLRLLQNIGTEFGQIKNKLLRVGELDICLNSESWHDYWVNR